VIIATITCITGDLIKGSPDMTGFPSAAGTSTHAANRSKQKNHSVISNSQNSLVWWWAIQSLKKIVNVFHCNDIDG